MDITKLPKGSANFRATYGTGSFYKKLTNLTIGGDLHYLHKNRNAIVKVVKEEEHKIRLGTFHHNAQLAALRKIAALEGNNFSYKDKIATKKILKGLGERESTASKIEEKKEIKGEMARDEVVEERLAGSGLKRFTTAESRPTTRFSRVNRDTSAVSSNGLLSGQARPGQSGFASSLGGGRQSQGDRARLGLRYEQMSRLGGGEVARDIQKKTFAQLQAVGGPITRPGQSKSNIPSHGQTPPQAPHPINPLNTLNRF